MLHQMLLADRRAAALCGNIGEPVLDVLSTPSDLFAVRLSSFSCSGRRRCGRAGAVLNVAEDHLDWHGGLEATQRPRRSRWGRVAVAGLDDERARDLLSQTIAPGVGFRIGEPAPGELGCATGAGGPCVHRRSRRTRLARVDSIPIAGRLASWTRWPPPRWPGRSTFRPDVAEALAGFRVGRHRAESVGLIDGSAMSTIQGHQPTPPRRRYWPTAGGLGGRRHAQRGIRRRHRGPGRRPPGRGSVDRPRPRVVAKALSRHAPDVPVIQVVTREDAEVQEANGSDL